MPNSVKATAFWALGCAFLLCVCAMQPAFAVLEGSLRNQMESLDYSESLIRDTCYANLGSQVFDREHRRFVRGIREHGQKFIYEPDDVIWKLAMKEHRQKLAKLRAKAKKAEQSVLPTPMQPAEIMPSAPTSPFAQQAPTTMPPFGAPAPAGVKGSAQRIGQIRQRLLQHMNSLDHKTVPALLPALPTLPNLPKGKKADSFDAAF